MNVIVLREDGIRMYPSRVRYAWPPEIDLMARLAGLALTERWADWRANRSALARTVTSPSTPRRRTHE